MLSLSSKKTLAAYGLLGAMLPLSSAYAAVCATNTSPSFTLNTTDVTVTNASNVVTAATGCYLVTNTSTTNQTSELQNVAQTQFGPDNWTYVAKYDAGGTYESLTWSNLTFSLSGTTGKSGTFNLNITGAGLPKYLDFVFAVDGGNSYEGLYFFNELFVDNSNPGTWKVSFPNNGTQIPNLSHISLLVRNGSTTTCDLGDCTPNRVPEPASLSLMGIALAGVGFVALRRRRKEV